MRSDSKAFLVVLVAVLGIGSSPTMANSLDKRRFFKRLKPQYGELRRCHTAEAKRDPHVNGRYRLRVAFSKEGHVTRATATSTTLRTEFLRCAEGAALKWKLGRLPTAIEVMWPLVVVGPSLP